MELHVFLAVVLAAALHASWNAIVKGGGDPLLTMTHMAFAGLVLSAAVIPFVPAPTSAAWPWLILSVLLWP
jgi:hypothetical protein